MIEPDPPFLEIGFFFDDRDEPGSLESLVSALVEEGARVVGLLIENGNGESLKIARPLALSTVSGFLHNRNLKLYLKNASGIGDNNDEVVTYVDSDPEALTNRPVEVWASGDVLDGEQSRSAGAKIYARFKKLCAKLDPLYAAITVEEELPTPSQLMRGVGGRAFADFFWNRRALDDIALADIESSIPASLREELPNGVLVAMNDCFNPKRIGVTDIDRRSRAAAALLIESVGRIADGQSLSPPA